MSNQGLVEISRGYHFPNCWRTTHWSPSVKIARPLSTKEVVNKETKMKTPSTWCQSFPCSSVCWLDAGLFDRNLTSRKFLEFQGPKRRTPNVHTERRAGNGYQFSHASDEKPSMAASLGPVVIKLMFAIVFRIPCLKVNTW